MSFSLSSSQVDWNTLRALGAALWISNPTNLKTLAERLAKSQFAAKKVGVTNSFIIRRRREEGDRSHPNGFH